MRSKLSKIIIVIAIMTVMVLLTVCFWYCVLMGHNLWATLSAIVLFGVALLFEEYKQNL